MKLLLSICAVILLGCSTGEPVPVKEPSFSITSSESEPRVKTICVDSNLFHDSTWPVEQGFQHWNANKVTFLTRYFDGAQCHGRVIITAASTQEFWGRTQVFLDGVFIILVSSTAPVEHRQHILCHELGHVLGSPHTSDKSCMNIDHYYSEPSLVDLQKVSSETWDWRIASRQMHGK